MGKYDDYFARRKAQRANSPKVAPIQQDTHKAMERAIETVKSLIEGYEPCIYTVNGKSFKNGVKGQYHAREIEILSDTTYMECLHELGHHVHSAYFHNEAMRVPRTTEYSHKNHKEGFAEGFKFYALGRHHNSTDRMAVIMASIA